jgi:rhodanese-related sulfurtransferase
MGAMRSSSIGYERRYNPALQHKTKESFKKSLLTGMPDAPDHFSRCSAINGKGPAPLGSLPEVKPLGPRIFWELKNEDHIVVDLRDYTAFGGSYIPGSYNLDLAGNFSTFAGWVLPPDKPLLLVGGTLENIKQATIQLHRVGLDQVIGCLDGGIRSWANQALPLEHILQITVQELKSQLEHRDELVLLDVRAKGEWDGGHIEGSIHMPFPDCRTRYGEVQDKKPVVVICNTALRASLAASILKQHGLTNLSVLAGGMTAWRAAGYSETCPTCEAPHGPRS